jgi:hypothetical protein
MVSATEIKPPDIEWLKNLCYLMSIPSFAMLLKFFLELLKLGAGMYNGSAGGVVENEKIEQGTQSTEARLLAVNSDIVGIRRTVEAHDKRFDKMTERVDRVYEMMGGKIVSMAARQGKS